MPDVEIVEVSPRDGLQNEPGTVPTEIKVALIERENPLWSDLWESIAS